MASAMNDVSRVPKASAAMPKWTVPSGSQICVVQKLLLSACSAGIALTTRKTAIAPNRTKTSTPASNVMLLKVTSPRRLELALRSEEASEPVATMLIVPPRPQRLYNWCWQVVRSNGAVKLCRSSDAGRGSLGLLDQRLRQRREPELVGG